MNTDDQMAALGRLYQDHADANRQRSLLEKEIEHSIGNLRKAVNTLGRAGRPERHSVGFPILNDLIKAGGARRNQDVE